MMSRDDTAGEEERAMRKTVLASMVPDEIIRCPVGEELREFAAVMLMGDVSGFTYLCDQYSKVRKGGISKITSILNQYIGGMVKLVYKYKGDVLNYSGDAYLAMWKYDSPGDEAEAVRLALDCALFIQKKRGRYETDVKVLTVKIAVALGQCSLALLGTDTKRDFIVYGQAVVSVKEVANLCQSSDVLVSEKLWNVVSEMNRYSHEKLSNSRHVRLTGYVKLPQDVREAEKADGAAAAEDEDIYRLRPSLKEAAKLEDEGLLSVYLMPQVTKGIELNQTVESLTELRQVIIVFLNVITETDMTKKESSVFINRCYVAVLKLVEAADGALNKTSLFDKDLMFLALFGLRYFKQGMVGQTALKCAASLVYVLSRFREVRSVSVGVTTGIVYCGVVGHQIRKEYTAMGATVNKAARLMVAYENKVTCDRETFLRSRMNYKNFELQEPKQLKGISNVGPIYMYNLNPPQVFKNMTFTKAHKYPLLGRDSEMMVYRNGVNNMLDYHNRPGSKNEDAERVIAYYSEPRYGKSRLLDELASISQNLIRVARTEMNTSTRRLRLGALNRILCSALDLTDETKQAEKMALFTDIVDKCDVPKSSIDFLYIMFQINIGKSEDSAEDSVLSQEPGKVAAARYVLRQIVDKCFAEPTAILIDNAENIDDESWSLLDVISNSSYIYLVLTIGLSNELSSKARSFLSNDYVLGCHLKPIHKWFHVGISCQVLDVIAVPYQLLTLIEKESRGNPGWIENYLLSSFQAGLLYITSMTVEEMSVHGLMLAPSYMIQRAATEHSLPQVNQWSIYQGKALQSNLEDVLRESKDTHLPVCLMHNVGIEEIPQSMDSLIMLIIDNLDEFTKTVLKCCSTIGEVCRREMLEAVIQTGDEERISSAIQKLFSSRILTCTRRNASLPENNFIVRRLLLNTARDISVACYCEKEDKVSYGKCRYFCFRSKSFKDTAYYLLSTPEKKYYHTKSAQYMEAILRRCDACSNERFNHMNTSSDEMQGRWYTNQVMNPLAEPPKRYGRHLLSFRLNLKREAWVNPERGNLLTQNMYVRSYQLISYSQIDMTECKCQTILKSFYTEILRHSVGSESWDRCVDITLELVPLLMDSYGVKSAWQLVSDALNYVDWISSAMEPETAWKVNVALGALHTLSGLAYFRSGQFQLSIASYQKACYYNGVKLPWGRKKSWVILKLLIARLKRLLANPPTTNKLSRREAISKLHKCRWLELGCRLYMRASNWKKAHLCGCWGLVLAIKCGLSFSTLCTLINLVFGAAKHYPNVNLYASLEEFTIRAAAKIGTNLEIRELKALFECFCSIFQYTFSRGHLKKAMAVGKTALTVSLPPLGNDLRRNFLPRLVVAMLMTLDLEGVYQCLREIEAWGESDPDDCSKVWYYGTCVYVTLYLGVRLVDINDVEYFFMNYSDRIVSQKDPLADGFLSASLWLWCVRNEHWNRAKLWSTTIINSDFDKFVPFPSILLMMFEGFSILTNQYMGLALPLHNRQKLDSLAEYLRVLAKSEPAVRPRLLHLLGYRHWQSHKGAEGSGYLAKAKKEAQAQDNIYEVHWVGHNERTWERMYRAITCRWRAEVPITVGGNTYKIVFYTLPLS